MAKSSNQLNHLAIIPDGNTRWAAANRLPAIVGYQKGTDRVVELTKHARTLGIHTLTFWGLSTENWQHRPKKELEFLVLLFQKNIDDHIKDALENGVRIVHLGRKDRLPKRLMDKISEAEQKTKDNDKYFLNMALDYGGQDEIIRASQKIASEVKEGKLKIEDLEETVREIGKQKVSRFASYLDNGWQPYPFPDFIIRTSGEERLSGFMPVQSAYSELYFEPKFFPDLSPELLEAALEKYQHRQRRFGGGHKDESAASNS
jgi:undecaprenyl diphosphate synthase